jgi:hypothetical protein
MYVRALGDFKKKAYKRQGFFVDVRRVNTRRGLRVLDTI